MNTLRIVLLLTLPLFYIWTGYALSVVWGWHIAPIVHIDLGISQAIGVSMVVGYLSGGGEGPTVAAIAEQIGLEEKALLVSKLIHVGLRPGVLLLAGWLLKVLS
jgi:hypothetical protein